MPIEREMADETSETTLLLPKPDSRSNVNADLQEFPNDLKEGHGSMLTSVFNLTNAALGAGVLAFPYAYAKTGLISGLLVTLILLLLLIYSLHVLTLLSDVCKASSYQEMVTRILGKRWAIFCQVVMTLYLFGACIAYMTVIGDMGAPVLQHWAGSHFYTSRGFLIAGFAVVILPLCFLKRVDVLSPASALAMLSCAYLTGFVTVEGIMKTEEKEDAPFEFDNWSWNTIGAFPLITFAFTCHVLLPPVYAEMKDRTVPKMDSVIVTTMSACTVLYVPLGVFGYLTFGNNTDGDILTNFDITNIPADLGRFAVALTVTLAYPINNYAMRGVFLGFLFKNREVRPLFFYGLTIGLFIVCLVLAIAAPGITVIFSILGSSLGVILVFGFPALCTWKLQDHFPSKMRARVTAGVLLFFGLFLGIAGTTVTIYDIATKH